METKGVPRDLQRGLRHYGGLRLRVGTFHGWIRVRRPTPKPSVAGLTLGDLRPGEQ